MANGVYVLSFHRIIDGKDYASELQQFKDFENNQAECVGEAFIPAGNWYTDCNERHNL